MLADLQKPVVPQAVQSVLNSAAAAAAEAQAAKNASKSRSRGGADTIDHVEAAGEQLWQIPPLGHAKQANRADVSVDCLVPLAALVRSRPQ